MSEVKKNLLRGQNRFRKWIIPGLLERFGGSWQCIEGTKADITRGVDWYWTSNDYRLDWSVRIWMSKPRSTFSGRLTHSDRPSVELEVGQKLNQVLLNQPRPHYHCEAFIHRERAHVNIAPFDNIWLPALIAFPELETFKLHRNNRTTSFIRIPHAIVQGVESFSYSISDHFDV